MQFQIEQDFSVNFQQMLLSSLLACSTLLAPSHPVLLFSRSGDPRVGVELVISGPAGSRPLGLSQPESAGVLHGAVSPDRTRIAFLSGPKLYIAPLRKEMVKTGLGPRGAGAREAPVLLCDARRQRDGSWTGARLVSEGLGSPVNWAGPSSLVMLRPTAPLGPEGDIVRLDLNADGSLRREAQITNVGFGTHRDSSPRLTSDGRKLLFVRFINREGPQLMVSQVDGRDLTQLPAGSGIWSSPAWSRDGAKIAALQGTTATSPAVPGAYVMNSDGADARLLIGTSSDDGPFVFSPDGSEIAHARLIRSGAFQHRDIFRRPSSAKGASRPFIVSPGMTEIPLQWFVLPG